MAVYRFLLNLATDPVFWLIQSPAYALAAVWAWDRHGPRLRRRWQRRRAWR